MDLFVFEISGAKAFWNLFDIGGRKESTCSSWGGIFPIVIFPIGI